MRLNLSENLNLYLFIFLCLGIITGHHFAYFYMFLALSVAFLFLIYFFYRKKMSFISDVCIVLFFILLGAALASPLSIHRRDDFLNKESAVYCKVISLPKHYKNKNIVSVQVNEINNAPIRFKVHAMDFTRKLDYLDSYKLNAKLSKRKYQQRWIYALWIKSDADPKILPISWPDKLRKKITRYFLDTFKDNLSPQAHRFLASVFLGRRELLGQEKSIFAQIGASHLLAISGLHIGISSLILFFVLRLFNTKFRAALIISMIFLLIYTFITGASSSTVRAATMYSIFGVSFFMKRKVNPFNSLGLAGIVSLVIAPLALFEVGFQLSFVSVFAIIFGFRIFPLKLSKNIILCYIESILFSSFMVTLFLTPIISYYFGRIYILGILYNIILIPFFTLILIINFIFIIFAPFSFLAQSTGAALSVLIALFFNLIQYLSSIKLSSIDLSFSFRGVIIYYLILLCIIIILRYLKVVSGHRRHA